jgi:hypothetical protein
MNQAVYAVLSALPKNGRQLFPRSIRTAWEGAVERAGIKNLHFHDTRHDFASQLTMKGRPLREVQELLGHKTLAMTMRYSHLAPERLRDAVASLDFNTSHRQHMGRLMLRKCPRDITSTCAFQKSAPAQSPVLEPRRGRAAPSPAGAWAPADSGTSDRSARALRRRFP